LLAYNWPEGSDARNRLNKFISFFVANLPSLRSHEQAFHPKWREFDIWNSLPSTLRRDRFVIDRVNPMRKLNEEGSASNWRPVLHACMPKSKLDASGDLTIGRHTSLGQQYEAQFDLIWSDARPLDLMESA